MNTDEILAEIEYLLSSKMQRGEVVEIVELIVEYGETLIDEVSDL